MSAVYPMNEKITTLQQARTALPALVALLAALVIVSVPVSGQDVSLSFNGICGSGLTGPAGADQVTTLDCVLTTSNNPGDDGAQGWSISVAAEGGTITSITTDGTVGAEVANGGLRGIGFEKSETTDASGAVGGGTNECEGLNGAISAVVLSFVESITLEPEGEAVIARIDIAATAPQNPCAPSSVRVFYADGCRGAGQPVQNTITLDGDSLEEIEKTECSFTVSATAETLSNIPNMSVVQKAYGPAGGRICLGWTNGIRYDFIDILIDDKLVAELEGGLNEYELEDVPNGEHRFQIRGRSGCLTTPMEEKPFEVAPSTPFTGDLVANLACEFIRRNGGTIELSWGLLPEAKAEAWSSGVLMIGDDDSRIIEIRQGVNYEDEPIVVEGIGVEGVEGLEAPLLRLFFISPLINETGYYSNQITPACPLPAGPQFIRGDCNSDNSVSVSDAVFHLNHAYTGGERWLCDDACDANDDQAIDLNDVLAVIRSVFGMWEDEPPIPLVEGSRVCVEDESEDSLGGICGTLSCSDEGAE